MKLLVDTNVVLDILLRREPYYENAARIAVLSENEYISCYIPASAFTDIYYITQKELKNKESSVELLTNLLNTFRIANVTETNIYEALDLKWDDIEDCVQYVVGKSINVDYIITRNVRDFIRGLINAMSPKEFLEMITEGEK